MESITASKKKEIKKSNFKDGSRLGKYLASKNYFRNNTIFDEVIKYNSETEKFDIVNLDEIISNSRFFLTKATKQGVKKELINFSDKNLSDYSNFRKHEKTLILKEDAALDVITALTNFYNKPKASIKELTDKNIGLAIGNKPYFKGKYGIIYFYDSNEKQFIRLKDFIELVEHYNEYFKPIPESVNIDYFSISDHLNEINEDPYNAIESFNDLKLEYKKFIENYDAANKVISALKESENDIKNIDEHPIYTSFFKDGD